MIQWAGILILRQAGYFFSGVDPASVQLHRAGRRDPQTWKMDLPQENFLNPLFVNYIVDDFFYNYHYLNDDGISKLQIDSCTVSCFSVCAINKIPLLKGEKKISLENDEERFPQYLGEFSHNGEHSFCLYFILLKKNFYIKFKILTAY